MELLIKIVFFAGTYSMQRLLDAETAFYAFLKSISPSNELASIKRCELVPSGFEDYGEPRAG